ncbi:cysteine-rich DPF motif domain-containing protein 1 isoform X3 [Odocoileus virginianus]|uniref:Cysteine-rich DPF motif domain-containing protein 1 n=1 Tax=Odocoileus virginianus TaxID=9874 RepID=A0ABM4H225_ODOVR
MGILQARIPEWVAMPSSRGIFPTQASTADVPYRGRSLHLLSQRGSQAEGEEEVRHEAPPPPRSPASVAQAPRAGGRQWGPGPGLAAAEAAEMACETERNPLGVFKCQLCALTAPYSYKGQQPPDSQSVILLEESYVMRDPFTPDKGRFLIVGSRCSVCSKLVCVDPVGLAEPVPRPVGSDPGSFAPTALLEAHWLFFS